jgi:hypothetical protein
MLKYKKEMLFSISFPSGTRNKRDSIPFGNFKICSPFHTTFLQLLFTIEITVSYQFGPYWILQYYFYTSNKKISLFSNLLHRSQYFSIKISEAAFGWPIGMHQSHCILECISLSFENMRVVHKIRFPRSCSREERCYVGSGDTGV